MLKALDHIIVAVENLEETTKHWSLLLGTEPVWVGKHPEQGTSNQLFNFGDFYLELMSAHGTGGLADRVENFIAKNGEGLFGVSCASDDIEAEVKMWEAKGLTSIGLSAGEGVSSDNKKRGWKLAVPLIEQTQDLFIFAIEHSHGHNSLPPPAENPSDAVKNLDHIVITTNQADEVKNLLGETMGIRLALDQSKPEWNARLLFFRLDNHKTIEIAQFLKNPAVKTKFWGLSWQVDDIEAAHKRLSASGFNISQMRTGRKPATRVFTVRNAPSNVATLIIGKD